MHLCSPIGDRLMIKLEALKAFTDNYIWLLREDEKKRVAVIDPGDAQPVIAWLQAHPGWTLSDILITHHHRDHVAGVPLLREASAAKVHGPGNEPIADLDQAVLDNQCIDILGMPLQILEVPGHTRGHIAYHQAQRHWLFSGDTLFAAGCGRLFEGTPRQMYQSLQRFAALPQATQIYCAHEYTLGNLLFALAVEPDNPDTASRLEQVRAWRAQGLSSLPSTLALECATNPFLRCAEPSVKRMISQRLQRFIEDEIEVFTALRAWKDTF
jgi:hydroxyacylglutathione hydrolase